MSLLPIIYTSLAIFAGLVTTVLLVSYIIYKAKGGAPKIVSINTVPQHNYQQPRIRTVSTAYNTNNNYDYRNHTSGRTQNQIVFHKKPISMRTTQQPVRTKSTMPRIQVINKPAEKKIVVVRKSVDHNSYDSNNFLGYYHENESGVVFQS